MPRRSIRPRKSNAPGLPAVRGRCSRSRSTRMTSPGRYGRLSACTLTRIVPLTACHDCPGRCSRCRRRYTNWRSPRGTTARSTTPSTCQRSGRSDNWCDTCSGGNGRLCQPRCREVSNNPRKATRQHRCAATQGQRGTSPSPSAAKTPTAHGMGRRTTALTALPPKSPAARQSNGRSHARAAQSSRRCRAAAAVRRFSMMRSWPGGLGREVILTALGTHYMIPDFPYPNDFSP